MISTFRISCMDRVGKQSEFRFLIENILESNLIEGNFSSSLLYKERILVSISGDTITLSKLVTEKADALLTEVRDQILNVLVENFNARLICIVTIKEDGFSKHDFFTCKNYNPPKKTFLYKLLELLS